VDIVREGVKEQKRKKQIVLAISAGVAILLITLGLSRLKPAAPTVEKGTVYIDTVKRGPMLRQVRGPGSLVPEQILFLAAETEATVERLILQPGSLVKPDTVILELSNPELEQAAQDAEWQLKAGMARLLDVKAGLQAQLMNQKAQAAAIRSEYKQAQLQEQTNEGLFKEGLIADLSLKLSKVRAEELEERDRLEQDRLAAAQEAFKAQLSVQEAQVEQLRAMTKLRRDQVQGLKVRAGIAGVLRQVPVQAGQRLPPGTTIAVVVQPEKLKAELRIAETQARDVMIGQPAQVDTRNGIVSGKVSRVDPAVQNGTVTVDIALEGPLPKGARPDLSVDGTIELDRLADVVFVGRPAFGQEQSTVGLFKLDPDGDEATRVTVKLGKSSVNTVQILDGLQPGDKVILSDMSAWDAVDRVRLN
jgi:HlyD family secretion protein